MQYKPVNITWKFGFEIFINNFFITFLLKNYQLGGFTDRTLYMFSKAYCYLCGKRKFLSVRRVGLMTHREYRVDRPFPVKWLDNVWEPTPPPRSTGLSRLFNPCFPGLKLRHRHAVARIISFYGIHFYKALKSFSVDCTVVRNVWKCKYT